MIRDAILIASNSLCRVGELHQMRWGDVEKIESAFDSEELPVELVTLNIRGETSKTRNSRRIIVRGGQYFVRLRERASYTGKDDFVFASVGGNRKYARQKWYSRWNELMTGIGIEDYQERKLTWYSLRHFGITCRIRAGNTYSETQRWQAPLRLTLKTITNTTTTRCYGLRHSSHFVLMDQVASTLRTDPFDLIPID